MVLRETIDAEVWINVRVDVGLDLDAACPLAVAFAIGCDTFFDEIAAVTWRPCGAMCTTSWSDGWTDAGAGCSAALWTDCRGAASDTIMVTPPMANNMLANSTSMEATGILMMEDISELNVTVGSVALKWPVRWRWQGLFGSTSLRCDNPQSESDALQSAHRLSQLLDLYPPTDSRADR